MNYTMGRYIAELDAEGRDRLIAAPEFNDGGMWWNGQCGCLVGTALRGIVRGEEACRFWGAALDSHPRPRGDGPMASVSWALAPASIRYPQAVTRFGKDRVVRAVKIRAARLNGTDPSSIYALTSEGSRVDGAVVGGGRS